MICLQILFLCLAFIDFSSAFTVANPLINLQTRTSANLVKLSAASPSVVERDSILSSSRQGLLERPVEEKTRKTDEPVQERRTCGNESWEVRLYNDGLNTREHVARCLVQVTGLSEFIAYQTMMHAHQHGMAVIGRYVFEIAELYHDQLKTNGLVCDMTQVDDE